MGMRAICPVAGDVRLREINPHCNGVFLRNSKIRNSRNDCDLTYNSDSFCAPSLMATLTYSPVLYLSLR